MRTDYARRGASFHRDNHHIRTRRVGYFTVGFTNILGTLLAGIWENAIPKNICLARFMRVARNRRMVHHDADDTNNGPYFLRPWDRFAGDRSPDQRSDRAYLWIAVYGNALWDRLLFPPIGQLCGRLVGRQDV